MEASWPGLRSTRRPPSARAKSGHGFRLLDLFGVEVRLDWSLAVIFSLVTVNLGAFVLQQWHPEWTWLGRWSLAVVAATLMFVSLLAHELAHAFTARALGLPVRKVTLFLFGGVTHLEGEPRSAKQEFVVAVVGPLVSFALGFIFTSVGVMLASPAIERARLDDVEGTLAMYRSMNAGATLLLWLGPLNFVLGAFNLVPGFPLDGGRVLRAIFWALSKDLVRATRWASGVGRVIAWALMGVGVMNVFAGHLAGGLWLLLIGWFLNGAAVTGLQQTKLEHALEDVPVARIMRTRVERLSPETSLDTFVREHLMVQEQPAYPVELGGVLLGLVTFEDVRRVPPGAWLRTPVRDVMTPTAALVSVPPQTAANLVLQELAERDLEVLPVLDAGVLLGLISRRDLQRWLALHSSS